METNRFNLVDEPWIPISGSGLVSLWQVFAAGPHARLGGNPVQKLALLKLLLAIAQAAATPQDEAAWQALGPEGLKARCLAYLETWHHRFWLYGKEPFLQMPAMAKAKIKSLGTVLPEIATGNNTVLFQSQTTTFDTDANRALVLVTVMGLALGGKKTDNSVVLTPGYQGKTNPKGKPSTGRPGSGIGFLGHLHSLLLGQDLVLTLWLNLLSKEQIAGMKIFEAGLGQAPWEQMPQGEDCPTAQALRSSLMGRLVPLNRFCLFCEEGLHYSEGIFHAGYKEGMFDPTMSVLHAGKEVRSLWVDPEKRPWRELTSILSFIDQSQLEQGFACWQIKLCLGRMAGPLSELELWSGGLRVGSNAGEQYVSGADDYVESTLTLKSSYLGANWFTRLKQEMSTLEDLSKMLYAAAGAYFKEFKVKNDEQLRKISAAGAYFKELKVKNDEQLRKISNQFWLLAERQNQALLEACCLEEGEKIHQLRQRFAQYANQVFDAHCPRESTRQLMAWSRNHPRTHLYLNPKAS